VWSWVLSLLGILCTVLIGKKYWWAWLISNCVNVLWIIFSITTKQYGFLLTSVVYAVLYWNNMVKWRNGKD